MLNAWGFNRLTVAGPVTDTDYVAETLERANEAARDRGIDPGKASDALDASRDLILDEATRGAPWQIENGTLYVVYGNVATLESVIVANP